MDLYILDLFAKIGRTRLDIRNMFSSISGGSERPATMRYLPLCDFRALIVTTITHASGFKPL